MLRAIAQTVKSGRNVIPKPWLITNGKEVVPAAMIVPINNNKSNEMNQFNLTFSPHSLNIVIGEQNWISKAPILDNPIFKIPVTTPKKTPSILDDLTLIIDKSLPTISNEIEKQAVRLIVIRRKKMKKHKLRKLRKKMKYEWAKVKLRRKIRREKAFHAELIANIKTAEMFSAEKYVDDKLAQANHQPLPRFWKGKRLPQFIIRQLMGIDKKINYKHNDVYKA